MVPVHPGDAVEVVIVEKESESGESLPLYACSRTAGPRHDQQYKCGVPAETTCWHFYRVCRSSKSHFAARRLHSGALQHQHQHHHQQGEHLASHKLLS